MHMKCKCNNIYIFFFNIFFLWNSLIFKAIIFQLKTILKDAKHEKYSWRTLYFLYIKALDIKHVKKGEISSD